MVNRIMAQQGTILGKVLDNNHNPIQLATVTIFTATDTSIITYRMSNDDGVFKVPELPFNKQLRVMITYSGYEAFRKTFVLTNSTPSLSLDPVILNVTSKLLDEVIVISERPLVSIKNDTIEFNANAFKTLPNALVEDLLRKLPGVRVDANGNITVNGKSVNKILVDGKTFFGDDPKMASRNLPANIIDKVQVVDDKEQAMLNGDNNLNNVGKVVNITLKKGVKKGMFGKAYVGGGTKDRYEVGGITNIFRDTLQVSILGYSNNLNRPGFSYGELMNAGGLQRSNSNRTNNSMMLSMGDNGSSFNINGINFGGTSNFGLSTSNGAGFNINHAPDQKKSFYLQYYFGKVRTDKRTNSLTEQYNADTIIQNNTLMNGIIKNYGHNVGGGFKLQPDSVTTINFNAGYTIGLQRKNLQSNVTSDNNLLGELSQGNANNINRLNNYNYSQSFYLLKQSRSNKQRQFIVTNQFSTGTINSNYETNSKINYFYPTAYDSVQDQLRQIHLPQTSLTQNLIFKEPLSKLFTFRLNNRYRYDHVSNSTNTFNTIIAGGNYNILNPLLSNSFHRDKHDITLSQGLQYQNKGLSITSNVQEFFMFSSVSVATINNPIHQNIRKLIPSLDIIYKNIALSYYKEYNLPEYTYLMPLQDNSNPYYIVNGNPYLLPSAKHDINANYNFNDQKSNLNVWLYADASFTNNAVIQRTLVNDQGIQTTMPINADGSSNYYLNYNVNKDIKIQKTTTLTLSLNAYYGIDRSRLFYNKDSSWQTTAQIYHWLGLHLNFNDIVEWDNSYNPRFNFTRYSSREFSNLNVTMQHLVSGIVIRYPKHIIWESNFDYTYNSSLGSGNKNLLRWNSGINFTFLKDDKGVLKFSAYDILNKNRNLVHILASKNTLSYNRGNMLPQYFMVTFTYNIRSVGSKKQKVGRQGLFSF